RGPRFLLAGREPAALPPAAAPGAAPLVRARAINGKGEVAGGMLASAAGDSMDACLWVGGGLTGLGSLVGATCAARAVNDATWIVGDSQLATRERHAFLWREGRMEDLGTLGGSWSSANAINDRGWVVGETALPDRSSVAFLYQQGRMRALKGLADGAWASS